MPDLPEVQASPRLGPDPLNPAFTQEILALVTPTPMRFCTWPACHRSRPLH